MQSHFLLKISELASSPRNWQIRQVWNSQKFATSIQLQFCLLINGITILKRVLCMWLVFSIHRALFHPFTYFIPIIHQLHLFQNHWTVLAVGFFSWSHWFSFLVICITIHYSSSSFNNTYHPFTLLPSSIHLFPFLLHDCGKNNRSVCLIFSGISFSFHNLIYCSSFLCV